MSSNPIPTTKIQRHPLNAFADHWALDGDYIRCRCCNRPQQVGYALHPFRHAAGCSNEGEASDPWKVLASLITAQISRAKYPHEMVHELGEACDDGCGD